MPATQNKAGRPTVREGARATVHVVFRRDLVERLDRAVCLRMFGQGVPVEDMTPRVIASERREWLEALAERSLSAIGDVELSAPAGGTARELREAAAWLETETERLRACAPVAVQRALRVFESTRGPSEPRSEAIAGAHGV